MAMADDDLPFDLEGEDGVLMADVDLPLDPDGEGDGDAGDVLERACLDVDAPVTAFCKVYQIHGESRKVVGVGPSSQQGSPSALFRDCPSLNVDFAVGSVFRGRKKRAEGRITRTSYLSCFVLSPPFIEEDKTHIMCATAGHCYSGDIKSMEGCFGGGATDNAFNAAGFACPLFPLHLLKNSAVDVALFRVSLDQVPRNLSFLLPCSPDRDDAVAGFGFPCILSALQKAKEELVDEKASHGVWDSYSSVVGTESKQALYDMLWETFSPFRSGDLVCSPGRVTDLGNGNKLQLCTSTLPGNSGGPVMVSSAQSQGYFIGIHRSGAVHANWNYATSTDSRVFVEYYRWSVLPHLPGEDDVLWTGRNMEPFVRWLKKHGLYGIWKVAPVTKRRREQTEEDFTTPPATSKSISVGSSFQLS